MTSEHTGPPGNEDIEQIVADYLNHHPDFFNRHTELLEELRVPHPCRPAVSLVERQIMLLREQNSQLRKKFHDLVKIARDNDCLSKRMQQLNLVLIEASQLEDMIAGIQAVLREEFSADFTSLGLLSYALPLPAEIGSASRLPPSALNLFAPLFDSGRPLCGRLTGEQMQMLFSDVSEEIGSSALLPLNGIDWRGIIAIGSCDPKRFHSGMGTLFLSRIGELISHALQPHLQISQSALPASPG